MINLFAFFSKDVLRITPRLIPAVGIKLNNEEKINNPLCKVFLNQEISPSTPNIQNSLPPSHYNLMMNVGACQAGVRSRCWCLVVAGPLTLPPTTQTRFLMEPSRGGVYPQPPHQPRILSLLLNTQLVGLDSI